MNIASGLLILARVLAALMASCILVILVIVTDKIIHKVNPDLGAKIDKFWKIF